MFNVNPETLSAAFNNAIEQVANLSDSDGITRIDKTTYDDRYAHHTFTYTPDYVVGIPGSPRGTNGGPIFN